MNACVVCGCTELSPCNVNAEILGGLGGAHVSCHWVKPGLCSACAPYDDDQVEDLDQVDDAGAGDVPLLYDGHGVPVVWRGRQ